MGPTIVITAGFATLFGIAYYAITTRQKERMTILETGTSPDLFRKSPVRNTFLLTLGIVSMMLSLGIAVGYLLEGMVIARHQAEIAAIRQVRPTYKPSHPEAYLISVFFFVGLGLVLSYFIGIRESRKDKA